MHIRGNRLTSFSSETRVEDLCPIRGRAFLGGTALVSAAFIAAFGAAPVGAQVISIIGAGAPQNETNAANCVSATDCIIITTVGGPANTIVLDNSGNLTAGDDGIETATEGASITIDNSGIINSVDAGISASIGAVSNTAGDGGTGGAGGLGGLGGLGGAGHGGS